jgi:hypothetical protein
MAIRSLVLGCFDSAKESKSLKFWYLEFYTDH